MNPIPIPIHNTYTNGGMTHAKQKWAQGKYPEICPPQKIQVQNQTWSNKFYQ